MIRLVLLLFAVLALAAGACKPGEEPQSGPCSVETSDVQRRSTDVLIVVQRTSTRCARKTFGICDRFEQYCKVTECVFAPATGAWSNDSLVSACEATDPC